MYNTCYRIVRRADEAEDIMQNAFIDAFNKLGQYRAESAFGPWLRRIVTNKAIDAIRNKVNFVELEENNEWLIPETDQQYFENMEYCLDEIKAAMNQLPDNDRIILSLHLIEGYDHQELADILSITHDAVRARYSRAKRRLTNIITEKRLIKQNNNN